ncbi:retinol dehydrogenase 8 [Sapajus apella]|uniref:Retinol dehydrogenase 8 n=1 Tax=Sapajus apella TaxID=9515 RepID=A0A6J3FST4_SAPAP|nr:retinol dehydrogenase 8 [Sapajus apella]
MNGESQVLPGRGHTSREGINMAAAPRTVLISGCSSGIGLELAVQLAHDPKKRYQGKRCRVALGGGRVQMASPALETPSQKKKKKKKGQGVVEPSDSHYPLPGHSISLVEPGPVVTEFEGKLLAQVSTAEFPGTDPDTLHYFRDLYLPASRELFRSVGQSPQDVVQAIVKVIGSTRPPLRQQTNVRYSPLTMLKTVDSSGSLYVRTTHCLLFRCPRLLSLGLRCLSCGCLPAQVRPR